MSNPSTFDGFVQNLRDAVELIFLPGLAIFLPWGGCFKFFRWLAGNTRIYRKETDAALAVALAEGMVVDATAWAQAYRLMRLVDHADLYLHRFRGSRWMQRYVHVAQGAWPRDSSPFLAITFHWASGLWGLRHMRESGHPGFLLLKDINDDLYSGRPILAFYARLRTKEAISAGGGGVIYTKPKCLTEIQNVLEGGGNVVALLDVPPQPGQKYLQSTFLGHQARFPSGLVHMAVSRNIPTILYEVSLDWETGKRILNIGETGLWTDKESLMTAITKRLESLILNDSPSWHHWPGFRLFLSAEDAEDVSAERKKDCRTRIGADV